MLLVSRQSTGCFRPFHIKRIVSTCKYYCFCLHTHQRNFLPLTVTTRKTDNLPVYVGTCIYMAQVSYGVLHGEVLPTADYPTGFDPRRHTVLFNKRTLQLANRREAYIPSGEVLFWQFQVFKRAWRFNRKSNNQVSHVHLSERIGKEASRSASVVLRTLCLYSLSVYLHKSYFV